MIVLIGACRRKGDALNREKAILVFVLFFKLINNCRNCVYLILNFPYYIQLQFSL